MKHHAKLYSSQAGVTLIELVLVIVLIVLISSVSVGRMDSLLIWKQKGDLRKLADTWEFLYREAVGRGEAYRLVLNLDRNSYAVRREVSLVGDRLEGGHVRNVDYLSGLRSEREQQRRSQRETEELPTLEEEFQAEDERQTGSLESLFYDIVFGDPEGPSRLAVPLEFPSLAEERVLTDGLRFTEIKTPRGEKEDGEAFIRFSPRGAADFAVVHLSAGETPFTLFMNPSTGHVTIEEGTLDFEWTLR